MLKPRLLRCGKCHAVMGLRHYVLVHRRANGVACPPVPCAVCEAPIGHEALAAFGEAVCSRACGRNHPGRKAALKASRDVSDQLAAMRQAQRLPRIYQRPRHAS